MLEGGRKARREGGREVERQRGREEGRHLPASFTKFSVFSL